MNKIGSNIKNFRTFRKMSQSDLAAALGKSKNVVSNWERGDNLPDLDTLEKICSILNVTPNQMYGWEHLPEYESFAREKKEKEGRLKDLQNEVSKLEQQILAIQKELSEINDE